MENFDQILAYIDQNLSESDLNLKAITKKFYVSEAHFSRQFLKKMGVGFKQFVIAKRIDKAMKLLAEGHRVTEACYSVGYNDLTHFARIFKRLVGVNPSIYRNQNWNGEVVEKRCPLCLSCMTAS